jgi:WD40 repeat protein
MSFFREGQSFAKPLAELATALRQDVEWIREHTRLGEAAARWQARTRAGGGAADDLLLRGDELAGAKAWAARRKDNAPEITPLLWSFLAASEDKAAALQNEERKRLAERERLVAETGRAQSNIRRVQRRSFLLLTGLALLVVLGTGGGLWAVFAGWRELMMYRALFLTGMIDESAGRGEYVDAMLIGLDALPDEKSASLRQRALPLEASAENALDGAWRKWPSRWGERKLLAGHTDSITAVAFSPDGALVQTGSWDKTARLWDAATGKTIAMLEGHTGAVTAVAFSPDGARVLTGSRDKTARLWDATTGKTVATLEGHTNAVTAVAFSPDGARVLTGSDDNAARLWDATTGKTIATLEGHTGPVAAVAFSPDGARVLTGSWDKTARLWDAATGKTVATLEGHTGPVAAVAFSPSGARVLTGSRDKTARLWPVFSSAQALVEEVKASALRCLTPEQRESFHLGAPPPRWCNARKLWPFADAAPSPVGWEERLLAAWDWAAAWFGKARAEVKTAAVTFSCLEQDSTRRNQRRHRERSVAIQGPPPQPYDPLDRRVASLLKRKCW